MKIYDLYNKDSTPNYNPQIDLGSFLVKFCDKKNYQDRDTKSPMINRVKLEESASKDVPENTNQDDTADISDTLNKKPSTILERNQSSIYSQLCQSISSCFGLSRN